MATDFLMPKLGLTMEEGTIVEWLVPDGAEVTAGTAVMTIETDKVETQVEASASGRLHQHGTVGQTYACGAVIGAIAVEGEAPAGGVRRFVSPNARRVAAQLGVDVRQVRGTGPGGRVVSEDVEEAAARGASAALPATAAPATAPAPATPSATAGVSVPATAAARQLAELLGVDLAAVEPDPVDRRVTRESVARHVRARLREGGEAAARAPSVAPLAQTPTEVRPLTGIRGTIAKRMHASLQQMAQLTLTMDAELDAVVADRRQRAQDGVAPGYTDYVVAAAARALRDHPLVNSQVTEAGIALLPDVHVGVAVALPAGLVVPVVRHADRLDLASLSAETTRLAEAARAGRLSLADLDGGTFSVTALGMFGVDAFTPVINPPNAAILGVGRLRDDVVLVDGAVTARKRLTLSLTWDHRVLDGAPAALFVQQIVALLADPASLDHGSTPY